MKRTRSTLALLALLLIPALALAQSKAPAAPDTSLADGEKARFAENILLPSPAEVFVALGKVGDADWNAAASYSRKYDYATNPARALNLGVRAADGFLAIQAKDKTRLGEMITVIMTLAEELLVQKTLLDKSKTFEDLAKQEKWGEVRQELDKLRGDVEAEMRRLGDDDTALLVSAGGWLEGLKATTKVLMSKYDEASSSVLYQPRLVDYFAEKLAGLTPEARKNPAVGALLAKLPEIKTLIDVGYQRPVPRESLAKLNAISSEIIKTIEKG